MYEMLRSKNEWMSEETIGFAKRLIGTPSVSLEESEAADLVEKEMKVLGYDKVFRDGAGNVIGVIFGREKAPTVLLSSHLDTVEETAPLKWKTAPDSAVVKDGRIYGKGASDCKGGLAAQVYTGALLKRSFLPLKGNLVVAATVAEENGLGLGSRFLLGETLPSMNLRPDFAVLGEPTGLAFYFGHDGWMEMDVKLESESSFEVEDAVQTVTAEMNGEYSAFNWEQVGSERIYAFENGGGEQATLRFRSKLSADKDAGEIVKWMRGRIADSVRRSVSVAVNTALTRSEQTLYNGKTAEAVYYSSGWMTDPFHPMVERASQALAAADVKVRHGKWKLERPGLGTSGGIYWNEFGVPVIGYGPGEEEEAHAPNESVAIDSILQAVYGNTVIAHGLIGVPVCGWTMDEI